MGDKAKYYIDCLVNGTINHKELFQAYPPEKHSELWEAIYVADNDHWNHGNSKEPNSVLAETLAQYANLFAGTYPNFQLLKDWIGHGYGYQGVRQDPRRVVAGKERRKRALVPGYGKGADAVLLAKLWEYEVVAVDVSGWAVEEARDLETEVSQMFLDKKCKAPLGDYLEFWWDLADARGESRNRKIDSGPIEWREGDFLFGNCVQDDETFDLIFDNYVSPGC